MARDIKTREYLWGKSEEWKQRYSKLYSCGFSSKEESNSPQRISFMSTNSVPKSDLIAHFRRLSTVQASSSGSNTSMDFKASTVSVMSPQSDAYSSTVISQRDKRRLDTMLLDMVRARNRELAEEMIDKPLNLPKDETEEDDESTEPYGHVGSGMGVRMTDRSISRSRVSRISTKRDMDIHSILAYTTSCPPAAHTQIPAFQKLQADSDQDVVPRWSIRRSMCPVCSQKWKDRRSISIIKNSGLKRNSSSDLPTVIAPARLRASITSDYVPRPALAAVDEDAGVTTGGLKNTSATWQLIRARRVRLPKPPMPPPESLVPPSSTAPLTRKDLDQRVSEFLKDELIKPELRPAPDSVDFDDEM